MNIREEQKMTQISGLGYSVAITIFTELIKGKDQGLCLIMRNLVWGVLSFHMRFVKRTPDATVR